MKVLTCPRCGADSTGRHGNIGQSALFGDVPKGFLEPNVVFDVDQLTGEYTYSCLDCGCQFDETGLTPVIGEGWDR